MQISKETYERLPVHLKDLFVFAPNPSKDEVVGMFPNTKAGIAVRSKSGGNTFGGDNPKPPMDDLGYSDSGSAARFFMSCPLDNPESELKRVVYSAKVSKRERDAGLELASSGIVCYSVSICENNTTLVGKSARLQVDTERLAVRVIGESGIQESDALLWNTVSCMKQLMEQSLKDLSSTTGTKINWTTELKTLNWLAQLLTSASIQVANSETTDGGNLVVNARNFFMSPAFTERKDGWLDNANRVASGLQLRISASEMRSDHPTLKPISLTTYLAKLILPPKLDQPRRLLVPFAGSGSEVIGGYKAGWDEVVGVEQDAEYCKIAEARIAHWISPQE